MFDTDKSGNFSQIEFEAAFNVMQINFNVSELRKLITLSDKNNDGKIDFNEFNDMLYAQEESDGDEGGFE